MRIFETKLIEKLPTLVQAIEEKFVNLQWLSELIECGNLQIGKPAVALWIPMTQK